jgi:uncharacterized membrane protein YkoI
MKHAYLRTAVCAGLVSLLVAGAAEAKPRPTPKQTKEAVTEVERHKIGAEDLKAAATLPVGLPAAIAAAEEKTGGKLVDIVLDATAKGGAAYAATLVKGDDVVRANVDATSAAVQPLPARKSKSDRETVEKARALTDGVTDLKQMVGTVEEQHGGAKAVEAEILLVSGYVIYDMQLANNGAAERVAIEARSGRPIGNPRALDTGTGE